MPPIIIEKLRPNAKVPDRAHTNDAGLDLYSSINEVIAPKATSIIPVGFSIDLPAYHAGLVLPRSGLAAKGVTVMNAPGLIDPGYTGEVQVILFNSNEFLWYIHEGDRIAQLFIISFQYYYLAEGKIKNNTSRGQNGFGSTGE